LLILNRQLPTHTSEIKKRLCKVEITAGQETAKTTFKKETPKRQVYRGISCSNRGNNIKADNRRFCRF